MAVSDTHSHKLPRASSTARGIVRVANTLTGTATDDALSAAMGKKLADEKLGNSGDQTITDGTLTVGRANTWNKIIMPSGRGNWILETNPTAAENVADSIRFNFKFEEPGKKIKALRFHAIGTDGETVAYQSWVMAKAAATAAVKADAKRLKEVAAYAKSVGIAADQLVNAVLGGRPSETLSVRAYRLGVLDGRRGWRRVVWVINKLFWWQKNHCRGTYAAAVNRCTYKNKSPADVWQGGIHKR